MKLTIVVVVVLTMLIGYLWTALSYVPLPWLSSKELCQRAVRLCSSPTATGTADNGISPKINLDLRSLREAFQSENFTPCKLNIKVRQDYVLVIADEPEKFVMDVSTSAVTGKWLVYVDDTWYAVAPINLQASSGSP